MWTKGGCGPKAIPIEGAWLKLYQISKERGFWDLALENPAMGSNCCWALQNKSSAHFGEAVI